MVKARLIPYLFSVLLAFGGVTSCQKYEVAGPVDKTELGRTISTAVNLVLSTREGAASENYIRGSQVQFVNAISAAQTVYATASPSQAEITTANNALNGALATFQSQKVVQIDPANLVGQWTFDQVPQAALNDAVHDYSGNGHHGNVKAGHPLWGGGIPTSATDRHGDASRALHFDKGANIEIPYSADINPSKISISLWAKAGINTPSIIDNQYLVAMNRWNCYALKFQNTPKAMFTVNPAENPGTYISEDNSTTLSQGVWRHIVVTFGEGHMMFYVNGNLVKDWVHSGTVIKQIPAVNLVFGQDLPTNRYSLVPSDPAYVNNGGYYIGYLDEVRIYKSVLTPAQVTSIYQLEKP